MENNRLLIIACVIIVLVVGGCAIFFMTSQPAKLNSISYQGIIINIYSNSLNETVNNDTMFQVIDNDNNIKYTYEVCTGAKSGTNAQELVRQHQGVAYFVGNYTYIVGYATSLNNETDFNATEIILNVTNGTLIDFNELKDKPVPRTTSSRSSSSSGDGLTEAERNGCPAGWVQDENGYWCDPAQLAADRARGF